ncbi:copper homeostasis protein CutC [Enterococcus dongliensis]|uniref:PF03932 family protein CutC n=1 Tax=Enterococcus dongliensis TaxID=2559925 RepID=A0AAP5NLH2_9ENTE|nr:copper homeostasis protein CutC [Enterococcus dongliensis]MDT2596250.1 copper homeostasis protein CutC [Enterococcus dongliensis]MDT2604620.1 copper homeostasis protein CutC [Enterococcus dongliensis]MDT2634831.1 copper homeostasis protein CutC [Enterococcus dongliensis]MDT2637872.1 copper homeostasis protein CutC [Enterococcus dongliensis]MDT2639268.1 copper homeostasis protein CutC [Enterococcus dongliensis]
MIKEFCTENYTDISKAIQAGAGRIELCDNLAVGGTTPSLGVIEETLALAGEKHIPVMTMIRPRGGDFVYNDMELKIMENDLIHAKNAGTDGVVFGCLTKENEVDEEALEMLLGNSAGLMTTFHMAFDKLTKKEQFKTIDWFAQLGIDRILTHGGPASTTIDENLPHLKELVDYAAGRIIILPGGGITANNAEEIAAILGVNELHGTKIVAE